MRRLLLISLLVAAVAGGVYLYLNYELEVRRGQAGLESITIRPRGDRPAPGQPPGQSPDESPGRTIRIATFNLSRLDDRRLEDRRVRAVLADVIAEFDVVAVQEIRGRNPAVLLRLVDQVNVTGKQYDVATCPTVTRDSAGHYSAFLFDRASIEIDRSTVRSVEDPKGRFRAKPLVALFGAKGPHETEAFTFTLINVDTDPDGTPVKPHLLDELYNAVRNDGPEEDDVILLGELGGAGDGVDRLRESLDVVPSIIDIPTTLRGTRPVDNILLPSRATTEFTGRTGVLDLMRQFDLTWREASQVSEHLPVWAEFSAHEGGSAPYMAGSSDD